MGVAAFSEDGKTVQELLLAADQAELNAKKLGKNRVCVANSEESNGSSEMKSVIQ